jgi:hypothetical protein
MPAPTADHCHEAEPDDGVADGRAIAPLHQSFITLRGMSV